MTSWHLSLSAIALLAIASAGIGFAASRPATKAWCILVLVLSLCTGLTETMGVARPWIPGLMGIPTGKLLAVSYAAPKAIYLWILPTGASQPLYLALPWSEQQAHDLQQAMAEAKARGTGVGIKGRPGNGQGKGKAGKGGKPGGKSAGTRMGAPSDGDPASSPAMAYPETWAPEPDKGGQ